MSYHAFRGGDLAFYEEVCRHVSVPVCLYDNPRTTHVMLADELQGRIAALPAIASIKIPGLPAPQASERVAALRQHLPLALRLALAAMRGPLPGCRPAAKPGIRSAADSSPLLTGAGKSDT